MIKDKQSGAEGESFPEIFPPSSQPRVEIKGGGGEWVLASVASKSGFWPRQSVACLMPLIECCICPNLSCLQPGTGTDPLPQTCGVDKFRAENVWRNGKVLPEAEIPFLSASSGLPQSRGTLGLHPGVKSFQLAAPPVPSW